MTKLKRIFSLGTMDKESSPAFVKQGMTRHAENIRFQNNDGNDNEGKNIKGTIEISDGTNGNDDYKCIGAYFDSDKDKIYYFLATTSGQLSKVIEYDIQLNLPVYLLQDTTGVLNFDKDGYITGINEINGLLYWSEWGNNPRKINVERAKGYAIDGFTEDDIKVIKRPPVQKLRMTLRDTTTVAEEENHIEDIMIAFSYRWRYLDGEYSVLAPFTKYAFLPKDFDYDYSEQSNRSMINRFNEVFLEFYTGSNLVTEIQLVWKRSDRKEVWVIDDFNKEKLGYANEVIEGFAFSNNKTYRALPEHIFPSFYDSVPLTAKAQEIIEQRLIYANYKTDYDLKDRLGNDIEIDFSLELVTRTNQTTIPNTTPSVFVPTLVPKQTVKSNRDYEVGMAYLDEDGRMTTILNSKNNTIFVPSQYSITENEIKVTLRHNPPVWARYFRFFIRPNKKNYDQLIPTLFYEDGSYRWIKLEGADRDKIKEGDYLIIKSDTRGPLEQLKKTKVLEVKEQPRNFLEAEDVVDVIEQRPGLYYKIKPRDFRISIDDFNNFEISTLDTTSNKHDNPISGLSPTISEAHFYGDTLNDATADGNFVPTGDDNLRILVEIDSLGPDTFRWSFDDGATYEFQNIAITPGTPQNFQNGIRITFASDSGHSLSDKWYINGNADFNLEANSKSYGFFRIANGIGQTLQDPNDERIFAGARIRLAYEEYIEGNSKWDIDVISGGDYDNIQEWFFQEDIISQIAPESLIEQIYFVRGNLQTEQEGATRLEQNINGTMTMVIKSKATQNNDFDAQVKTSATSEIIQSGGSTQIILETEGEREAEGIYHEIGRTYRIETSANLAFYHLALTNNWEVQLAILQDDQDQTAAQDFEATLDFHNAFSYGNAVESYKIRDEFGEKGLQTGVRASTNLKEEYKEVDRVSDITWSDIYNEELNINGLSSFNVTRENFITLDKENSSIQKIHKLNGDLLVLQEDAIGIAPYNKNIVNEVDGGRIIGIAKNILDRKSYRIYGNGKYGISKNPETFVQVGTRNYFTDQIRGHLIRLANDGVTPLEKYMMDHYFSNRMLANKSNRMVAGYDNTKDEYLLHLPDIGQTMAYKEGSKGFPNFFTFEPEFILNANNECYAWKNGIMYKLNASETHNNFFDEQHESKIKFYFNDEFSVEKIYKAMSLEASSPWDVSLKTDLTSREIPKEHFVKKEDFWYSKIMGNTNGVNSQSKIFGLGRFAIVNGVITTNRRPATMSIGDEIISHTLPFAPNKIVDVTATEIILENNTNEVQSLLLYKKNQNIDGISIRGDILEVEMTNDDTAETTIRAVNVEVVQSLL